PGIPEIETSQGVGVFQCDERNSMSLIDDISEIREHNRRYGWFGADHPAVLRMACALENGSLSALDAKLARILISESVRPDADFSGAVAALSPMFWARGNIDLPESATL